MTAPYLPTLTLWQPHASLLAAGIKGPETRSWATKYRGRIGIASAKRKPKPSDGGGPWTMGWAATLSGGSVGYAYNPTENRSLELPLGVMMATAELVDCVPILGHEDPSPTGSFFRVDRPFLWFYDAEVYVEHADDQLPYGLWEPGRFAWLLADVKPVTERCPWCWGDVYDPAGEADPRPSERLFCRVCEGAKVCEPVPVRGRERLWRWTP